MRENIVIVTSLNDVKYNGLKTVTYNCLSQELLYLYVFVQREMQRVGSKDNVAEMSKDNVAEMHLPCQLNKVISTTHFEILYLNKKWGARRRQN